MLQDSPNESIDRQTNGLGLPVFMICVPVRDVSVLEGHDSTIRNRSTSDITRQVLEYPVPMRILLTEVDVPFLLPSLQENTFRLLSGPSFRQDEIPVFQTVPQELQKTIPKHASGLLERKEIPVSAIGPFSDITQSTARDKTMQVRMKMQVSTPRVKGCDDSWRSKVKLTLLSKLAEQCVARTPEEDVGHQSCVRSPQRVQQVRNREYDMVMAAREHSGLLTLEPPLSSQISALRAGAVAAGVEPNSLDMTIRTTVHVATELRGAAGRKTVRCKPQKPGESVSRKKRGQACREDRLDCRRHRPRTYHLRLFYATLVGHSAR